VDKKSWRKYQKR
jgi:Acetyl esterase (deacetylase)